MHGRLASLMLLLVTGAEPAIAQNLSEYRQYRLESTMREVVAVDAARTSAPRTLHERPALVQEVVWQAPYTGPADTDPVHDVRLTFVNDELYQVVVSYERARTAGLTSEDLVTALSTTYGRALLPDARTSTQPIDVEVAADMALVARWEDAAAQLWLLRSRHSGSPQFQLAFASKRLNRVARSAIVEARRIDALEAPQRELDRRAAAAAATAEADVKAREANKATFRP